MENGKNLSVRTLCAELERQKENSFDIVTPSSSIEARVKEDEVVIYVPVPSDVPASIQNVLGEYGLTDHAHLQVARKTGIPQRYYERMMTTGNHDLLARNINTWLPDKDRRLIRVLDGKVRALLSDRYRPIDNHDLLFKFLGAMKSVNEKDPTKTFNVTRADLSESRMYIRVLLPFTAYVKGDTITAMMLLQNSEVGNGKLRFALGVYKKICANGMWGDDVVSRVHLGGRLDVGAIDWSDKTNSRICFYLW